jgi:hypothetical protein
VCDAEAQPLPHLPERPVRAPPSGNLQKFPRGLGQFMLSFLAEFDGAPLLRRSCSALCQALGGGEDMICSFDARRKGNLATPVRWR